MASEDALTPRFIARVGHVRVFAAFASTATALALETAREQSRAEDRQRSDAFAAVVEDRPRIPRDARHEHLRVTRAALPT